MDRRDQRILEEIRMGQHITMRNMISARVDHVLASLRIELLMKHLHIEADISVEDFEAIPIKVTFSGDGKTIATIDDTFGTFPNNQTQATIALLTGK